MGNAGKKEIFIFSVYQDSRPEYANKDNHTTIMQVLDQKGIDYKELTGVYNNTPEKSILVTKTDETESLVKDFCIQFNQECYLFSDYKRDSYLIDNSGNVSPIGRLLPSTPEHAKSLGSYSIDPDTGIYWITE